MNVVILNHYELRNQVVSIVGWLDDDTVSTTVFLRRRRHFQSIRTASTFSSPFPSVRTRCLLTCTSALLLPFFLYNCWCDNFALLDN